MNIQDLKVGDEFQDSQIAANGKFLNGKDTILRIDIIGDHVYSIHNQIDCLIVATDMGNGNGKVISITKY